MIYVIYGIGLVISLIIAVAVCFKLDDEGYLGYDEGLAAFVVALLWPFFLPIAIIFSLGWLVYFAFLEKR